MTPELKTLNPEPPLLLVEGLEVWYDGVPVLFGVVVQARRGEIIGIVGPNGAGKSTLLKTIQGVLRPARGTIKYSGARIDGLPIYRVVDRGVTYVPETLLLFPEMTVLDTLKTGASLPRARDLLQASVDRIFALFPALKEKRTLQARMLSGGEQQMLAVARGLMTCPSLLLLDDPFRGLERSAVDSLCRTLKEISSKGTAILLAGQSVRTILHLSDRAYLLEEGKIIAESAARALLDSPLLRRSLLGA